MQQKTKHKTKAKSLSLCCGHLEKEGEFSKSRFGLDIETDNAIHIPRGNEKFYYSHKGLTGNCRRAHKQVRKWLLSALENQERRLAGVSYVVRGWRWDKDLCVWAGAWVVWTSRQDQGREHPSFLTSFPWCRACGAEGEDKAVRLTSYQQSNIKNWSQTYILRIFFIVVQTYMEVHKY